MSRDMPEYSISQLDKFEECALQYKFIYVECFIRFSSEEKEAWFLRIPSHLLRPSQTEAKKA